MVDAIVALIYTVAVGAFLLATALYSSEELAFILSIGIFAATIFADSHFGWGLVFTDILVIADFMKLKVITVLFGFVWYLAGHLFGNIAKWVVGIILLGILLWSQGVSSASDAAKFIEIPSGGLTFWLVRG